MSRHARSQDLSKRLPSESVLSLPGGLRAQGWHSGALSLVPIQELTRRNISSLWVSVSSTVKWVRWVQTVHMHGKDSYIHG